MNRALAALGPVLVLLGAAWIARLPDPVSRLPEAAPGVLLLTAGWAAGLRSAGTGRGGILRVLAVAAAARALLLLPAAPLSDDLYRYVWEGRIGNAGRNPFVDAPSSAELAPWRDDVIWPRVNHPDVPTVYPPLAQWWFRALAAFDGSPRAPRVAAALMDLVTTWLLARWLRRRGRPPALAAVFGWCPLAILESAGGGHVDALGIALLAAARVAGTARPAIAGAAGAASVLVKPVAILLVPSAFAHRPRSPWPWCIGASVVLLLWIPFLSAGPRLFAGTRTYAEHWVFNAGIYSVLAEAGLGPRAARILLAAVLVGVAFMARRMRDPDTAGGVVIAALLALSPTVHPWYGTWLVPFLPFLPGVVRPSALGLVALLPLAYVTPWQRALTGTWHEPVWPRAVLWGTAAALLLLGAARRARLRRARA